MSSDGGRDVADRRVRDVVALSTLPAAWRGAEPLRIAESLASAVYTTTEAKVVYVGFRVGAGSPGIDVAQTGRYTSDAALAARLGPQLHAWGREHDPGELLVVDDLPGMGALRFTARLLGFDGELGVVAAGFTDTPSDFQQSLLAIASTQASTAILNSRLVVSLRDADRRKDEFLATLAHELRNPLAPLRSSLQVMGMTGLSKAHRPLHAIMERQVNHLVRLVDDLLEVSRITRGTIELRMERVDIATVVRNAIETSQPHIQAAGHRFEVQLAETPLWVQGDVVRIAQIVSNLLNNACAYTAAGGRIALVVAQERSQVAIRISDTGRGIAPEQIDNIFRMFHRGGFAGNQPAGVGGLGIGLSLARHLAQLHGGSLHARSDGPGLGSEFILRLPLAQAAPSEQGALPGADSQAVGLRVLVVDDNADARETLAMLLRCLGAVVQVAADGEHGLEAHAEHRFDVILLDLGMPVMGGLEVARRIRAAGGHQPILVALTGWGQPEDRDHSREAGFDHHLLKPVELDVLQELLAALANNAAGASLDA